MYRYKKIVMFLILSHTFLLGQFQNGAKTKEYIEIFKDITKPVKTTNKFKVPENVKLSNLDLKIMSLEEFINSIPLNDFLNIIDSKIKAEEEDLFKLQEYMLKYDEGLEKKTDTSNIRFGIYEGIIRNRLKQTYGNVTADLIISPVLLKVRIVNIHDEAFHIDEELSVNQKIVLAEIQDIVKG